jgi:hypothetical protein
MVQNKKVGAGLALVAGLLGMFVSSTASALPEMEVGSRIASAAPQTEVQAVDLAVQDDNADDDAASDATEAQAEAN